MPTLGACLKVLREERQLSRRTVEQSLGWSRGRLARIESGTARILFVDASKLLTQYRVSEQAFFARWAAAKGPAESTDSYPRAAGGDVMKQPIPSGAAHARSLTRTDARQGSGSSPDQLDRLVASRAMARTIARMLWNHQGRRARDGWTNKRGRRAEGHDREREG